jgi:hypothetical protein
MTETIPGYHVWEAAGRAVAVQISLEMIDRLSGVVITGFGAIPRRGAEVGGILLGTISSSNVRVEDFEAVPCSYKMGPSYLLTDADSAAFRDAWEKWKPEPGKSRYAVGFYRSNTRDRAAITEVDRELCAQFFPPPSNVMLLINPHAMKVSTAGFLTYHDGRLEDQSALEFPFRSFELTGATPPRRTLAERPPRPEPRPRKRGGEQDAELETMRPGQGMPAQEADYPHPPPMYRQETSSGRGQAAVDPSSFDAELDREYAVKAEISERNRAWIWAPLSFAFLLLGLLLGFQAARTFNPGGVAGASGDPYAFKLTVFPTGDNLHVKWERQAASIMNAQRASLFIRDGSYTKEVQMDVPQLQTGSVIYRKLTGQVQFRLELYPKDRVVVSETVEWKQ